MAQFLPFTGVRYAPSAGPLDDLIAPPYDVVDDDDIDALEARSAYNCIRIEASRADMAAGRDRYQQAAHLYASWQELGVLATEDEPAFYAYRMEFNDEQGRPRHTVGVLGALQLMKPGEPGSDILPHEQTTPKAKSDRLDVLRTVRANTSPVWGLSMTAGLSEHCSVDGPGAVSCVDDDGVRHTLRPISDPGTVAAISAAVAANPVVVADGHHRFEVALAYQAEVGAGDGTAPQDQIMALVVELSDEQLTVRPIHRLIDGLSAEDAGRVPELLAPFFDVRTAERDGLEGRMAEEGGLGLITPAGCWVLIPFSDTVNRATHDLDSSRLDVALAGLPEHELRFQHGADIVARAVDKGEAQAGVLLRPATVDQIMDVGQRRDRMPPKTTFFWPKPRTGLVFRSLA